MADAAETREQPLHRIRIGNVYYLTLGAGRQCGQRLFYAGPPAGSDHYGGPFPCSRLRCGQTDAGAAAQHHDAFPIKLHV
jgi:hypothetical protein